MLRGCHPGAGEEESGHRESRDERGDEDRLAASTAAPPLTSCSFPDLATHIKAGTSSHSLNRPGHHSWLLDAADGQVVIAPRVLKGDAGFRSDSQPPPGSVLGQTAVPLSGFPVRSPGALGPSDQLQMRTLRFGSTEPRGQRSADEMQRPEELRSPYVPVRLAFGAAKSLWRGAQ